MVTLRECILHPEEIAIFCVTIFLSKGPIYHPFLNFAVSCICCIAISSYLFSFSHSINIFTINVQ